MNRLALIAQIPALSAANLLSPTTSIAASAPASKVFAIADWFALGSGCKAKKGGPGDVTMEFLGADKKDPNVYTIRFHLPSYKLDGTKPFRPTNPTFARECALRVSIDLPEKTWVKHISGNTKILYTKGADVKLQLAAQLHLGAQTVASNIQVHEAGKEQKRAEQEITVAAGAGESSPLPEQVCGSAKIAGFDLSITNWRKELKQEVSATLSDKKTVDLKVQIEPCIPLTPTPNASPSAPMVPTPAATPSHAP